MACTAAPAIPHSKPWITDEDRAAVDAVLAAGRPGDGAAVAIFEESLGRFLSAPPGLCFPSGRQALAGILSALPVGPGDEVLVPAYVCESVAAAVVQTGAAVRFYDVDQRWTLGANLIAPRLGARTRAIVTAPVFGILPDMPAITRLGPPVIEDLTQVLGGRWQERRLGRFGVAAFCSFQATKMITTGQGAMAVSGDGRLMSRLRDLPAAGKMSDLQAALGNSQLRRLEAMLERRRTLADRYFSGLSSLTSITLPESIRGRSVFYRFPVLCPRPFAETKAAFETRGIHVRRGVDRLASAGHPDAAAATPLQGSSSCLTHTVSLPLYPALTDAEQERVIIAAQEVFGQPDGRPAPGTPAR